MSKPIALILLFLISLSNAFAQNWIQKGVDFEGEEKNDRLGESVSLSGDGQTLAIGATGDQFYQKVGYVRVFQWNGDSWAKKGSKINGEIEGDFFGFAQELSIDGNTLVIGALYNDGNGTNSGHVRVYSWDGSAWKQKGMDIDGEAENDRFGVSVSISSDGHTFAAGSYNNDGSANLSGSVRVFSWNGSAWIQKGPDIDGEAEGDRFGVSVSLSSDGHTFAAGAQYNDVNGLNSGHVKVYNWKGNKWIQKGTDIDGDSGSHSGQMISLTANGNILAIGALRHDGVGQDAGQVRIFAWDGNRWSQKGKDIYGQKAGDLFGKGIGLSSNGETLAIGAVRNDGKDTNVGQVRVYTWSDNSWWKQRGSEINGEAKDDNSGQSISISSDGNILAIGAPFNDGNGDNAGKVQVYKHGWPIGIKPNTIGKVKVYPNPSSCIFTLNLIQTYQEIELKITSVLGQVVSTQKVEFGSKVDFEITENPGVYLVEITTSDGLLTVVKIIKE